MISLMLMVCRSTLPTSFSYAAANSVTGGGDLSTTSEYTQYKTHESRRMGGRKSKSVVYALRKEGRSCFYIA
jgi:hypothetical protein